MAEGTPLWAWRCSYCAFLLPNLALRGRCNNANSGIYFSAHMYVSARAAPGLLGVRNMCRWSAAPCSACGCAGRWVLNTCMRALVDCQHSGCSSSKDAPCSIGTHTLNKATLSCHVPSCRLNSAVCAQALGQVPGFESPSGKQMKVIASGRFGTLLLA